MRRRHMICWAAALLLSLAGVTTSRADVRVSGTADRLVLQVKDAPLTDILAALQHSLHIEIRVKGAVPQQFTGTYRGSLRGVLGHVLRGSDYLLSMSKDSLNIVLVGTSAKTTFMRAAGGDDLADNDPALRILAAAAASPVEGGSRMTRIRQQRLRMRSTP